MQSCQGGFNRGLSIFDVILGRKRIILFKQGKLWVFKHFFYNKETFKALVENYNEDKFRSEFKTFGERNKALMILDSAVFDYLFKFVINPRVEPTNTRTERVLRSDVVLKKILGTLRNYKETSIHERIMTTLATWEQKGLNSLQILTAKLAS